MVEMVPTASAKMVASEGSLPIAASLSKDSYPIASAKMVASKGSVPIAAMDSKESSPIASAKMVASKGSKPIAAIGSKESSPSASAKGSIPIAERVWYLRDQCLLLEVAPRNLALYLLLQRVWATRSHHLHLAPRLLPLLMMLKMMYPGLLGG